MQDIRLIWNLCSLTADGKRIRSLLCSTTDQWEDQDEAGRKNLQRLGHGVWRWNSPWTNKVVTNLLFDNRRGECFTIIPVKTMKDIKARKRCNCGFRTCGRTLSTSGTFPRCSLQIFAIMQFQEDSRSDDILVRFLMCTSCSSCVWCGRFVVSTNNEWSYHPGCFVQGCCTYINKQWYSTPVNVLT